MARRLSPLEVHQVKLLICEGYSQTDISRALDISQGTVSKICLGDIHRGIAWPNQEVGEKLMRKRGKRSEQDTAQAQLAAGIIQAPEPAKLIPSHFTEDNESEAIKQARAKADFRAELRKQIFERAESVEEEMNKEFLEKITTVSKEKREGKGGKKPTAWDAKFIKWEEVVERAGENKIVEVLKDNEDKIVQRAIGIVFFAISPEEWEGEQAIQMIASVVRQLKEVER